MADLEKIAVKNFNDKHMLDFDYNAPINTLRAAIEELIYIPAEGQKLKIKSKKGNKMLPSNANCWEDYEDYLTPDVVIEICN